MPKTDEQTNNTRRIRTPKLDPAAFSDDADDFAAWSREQAIEADLRFRDAMQRQRDLGDCKATLQSKRAKAASKGG